MEPSNQHVVTILSYTVATLVFFYFLLGPVRRRILLQGLQRLFLFSQRQPKPYRAPDYANKHQYVAMDCEMVGVGPNGIRSALARVSMVDWDLNVVLDTYVQVQERVTDYRTHVSGIRPKHLKSTNKQAMPFRKCQQVVSELLQGKIVVGHALENDWAVLFLEPPPIQQTRDTATYQPFQKWHNGKWRPNKLRELVKKHLRRHDFQTTAHDSIDDAACTMQLFHRVYKEWEKEYNTTSNTKMDR